MMRPDASSQPGPAQTDILLVVPEKLDDARLERAAAIASGFNAELQVFCPLVSPPVPHSGMTQSIPPDSADPGLAREQGRRLAATTLASFNERNIAAHVETGICLSMTEGILHVAERLRPDFIILPSREKASLLEQPFAIRFEDIWDKLDVPTWLLQSERGDCGSVVALLAAHGRGRDTENDRVAREAAGLAERSGQAVHLVVCMRQALAVATGRNAAPPRDMTSIPERRESRTIDELYELAGRYGIPEVHVHLYHGSTSEVLEQMLGPLGVGLVVVSGRPTRMLGGLMRRYRASELVGLDCDLLVLGETDVTHA